MQSSAGNPLLDKPLTPQYDFSGENQELWKLFTRKRERLVGAIQFDREWFEAWLTQHPAPAGIKLLPQELFVMANGEPDEEEPGDQGDIQDEPDSDN
jgi:hypothetical protein